MPEFAIAKLQRITPDEKEGPVGDPIPVQFNPSSLKLSISNATDTGKSAGRQRAQYLGTGSATLTVELMFDSADEGTTEEAKSVLDRTTPIEQLLLPQAGTEAKQSPPKVRFEWGTFVLVGIVDTMSLDLELFSEGGVPLRAKVGLTIKEQKSQFEFLKAGAGANSAGGAVAPGKAGLGAVGGLGLGISAGAGLGLGVSAGLSVGLGVGASFSAGVSVGGQTAAAIGGESAAEFAARVGLDPSAWRAIAAGQAESPLSLPAGAAIDFSTSASSGAGMGVTVGPQAGAGVPMEAAFGLEEPAPGAASAAMTGAGFALSAAGGVTAAVQTVQSTQSAAAAASKRKAFGDSAPPVPAAASSSATVRPQRPLQDRRALVYAGLPSRTQQEAAPPAPLLPRPDARAITYGLGVPLRARLGNAVDERAGALGGVVRLGGARRGLGSDPSRGAAGRTPSHGSSCRCGCGGK